MGYKSIVLAGGRGERLRPLTVNKTKPTRPVDGIPLIVHVLNSLENAGIDEANLAIAYKLTDVTTTVQTRYDGKMDFNFYHPHTNTKWEEGDLKPSFRGTADAVRQAPEHVKNYNPLIVASGDHVHNLSLGEAIEKHQRNVNKYGAIATIICVRKPKEAILGKMGMLTYDEKTGLIKEFIEKPETPDGVISDIGNAGIYICSSELSKYLDKNPQLVDFGKHVFTGDLLKDRRLFAHVFGEEWVWDDLGTLEDYRLVNLAVSHGIEGIERGFNYDEKTSSSYGKGCRVDGRVINSVIGNHAFIDKDSTIRGSVIGDNTIIIGTDVEDSITDKRVVILRSKGVRRVAIGESSELDYGTKIATSDLPKGEYRVIYPNSNIMNGKTIKEDIVYDLYF